MKNEIIISGYKSKYANFYPGEKATLYFQISRKNKNGSYDNFDCMAFGQTAEKLNAVDAGQPIRISGKLSSRITEKNGEKMKNVKVLVSSFKAPEEGEWNSTALISGTKGKYEKCFKDNNPLLYFQVISKTQKGFEAHDCVAFGNTAIDIENIEAGTPIEVTGRLSTRIVEKDGTKRKVVNVICNSFETSEKKVYQPADANTSAPASDPAPESSYTPCADDFVNIDDDIDDIELPFN